MISGHDEIGRGMIVDTKSICCGITDKFVKEKCKAADNGNKRPV
jgi:hypothetical protein